MKCAIVFVKPESGRTDAEDVINEVNLVFKTLTSSGWKCRKVGIDSKTAISAISRLKTFRPDVVFNLVDEFMGRSSNLPLPAAVYEIMGFKYTGSPFSALVSTNDKSLSKKILRAERIQTSDWRIYEGKPIKIELSPPFIVKPAWEHASLGINDDSVFFSLKELYRSIHDIYIHNGGQPLVIEEFIDGRELNVSLLESPDGGAEALPISEIIFSDWPKKKPKIVNYNAKWLMDTHEYINTQRTFRSRIKHRKKIMETAHRCWNAFNLRGYARVDMRLTERNEIYVIEVNSNPCISPDSGYIAAGEEAGYSKTDIINRIVHAALRRA